LLPPLWRLLAATAPPLSTMGACASARWACRADPARCGLGGAASMACEPLRLGGPCRRGPARVPPPAAWERPFMARAARPRRGRGGLAMARGSAAPRAAARRPSAPTALCGHGHGPPRAALARPAPLNRRGRVVPVGAASAPAVQSASPRWCSGSTVRGRGRPGHGPLAAARHWRGCGLGPPAGADARHRGDPPTAAQPLGRSAALRRPAASSPDARWMRERCSVEAANV
jgi:hypothetical protein